MKVILILTILMSLISCGKKSESNSDNPLRRTQDAIGTEDGLPITLSVTINNQNNNEVVGREYTLKGDAWVTVPGHLTVKSGDVPTGHARIYFDGKDGEYELFCDYELSNDIPEDPFYGCMRKNAQGDNEIIFPEPGVRIPVDKGRTLRLKYLYGPPTLESEVQAHIPVDYF